MLTTTVIRVEINQKVLISSELQIIIRLIMVRSFIQLLGMVE